MVTVTGYKVRQRKDGEKFITLELTGSLEILQSQTTGNMFATARKCNIPSTFDEPIAKLMVGSQLEGEIVRVASDAYEYTVKRTGEVVSLAYTYAYRPPGSSDLIGEGRVQIDEQEGNEKPPAKQKRRNARVK